jgi:NTP pyrophosphatase (non-canonical NTP hydrolase)
MSTREITPELAEHILTLLYPGEDVPEICQNLDWLAIALHARNAHFYRDLETGEPTPDNPTTRLSKLMLIVSEVAECAEGARKGIPDSHLPQFSNEEVEAADALIRLFDYAGWRNLRLGEAFWAKLEYNRTRQDHTDAARKAPGGKKI